MWLLLFITFIFYGCSSTTTSNSNEIKGETKLTLINALKEKKYEKFKNLLDKYNNISEKDRSDFLYYSLASGCSPENIRFILSKNNNNIGDQLKKIPYKPIHEKNLLERLQYIGSRFTKPEQLTYHAPDFYDHSPGTVLIHLASIKLCYKAIELLNPLVSASSFANAINTPIRVPGTFSSTLRFIILQDKIIETFKKLNTNDEQEVNNFTETGKLLGSRLKKDCANHIQESCIAKTHWEESLKKMEAIENEQKWWDGPEGTFSKACSYYKELQKQQGYIDYQKEVYKKSGAVRPQVLYDAGSQVVQLEYQIEQLKKKYYQQTKKKLNLKRCNFID